MSNAALASSPQQIGVFVDPAPILRQVAAPVDQFGPGLYQFGERLIAMTRAHHGIGLAAPQIGVAARIIAIVYGGIAQFMVNPVIVSRTGTQWVREGCLSTHRDTWGGQVLRDYRVKVEFQDAYGARRAWVAKALRAAIIQHEIDHLDGVLFTDKVQKGKP